MAPEAFRFEQKKLAWETCKARLESEISLFWNRGLFFWTFIASTFVAYQGVATDRFTRYVLITLGVALSYLWTLAMRGSRRWQIEWEERLKEIEKDITGPLYFMPTPIDGFDDKSIIRFGKFSVSKIAILIGYIVVGFWFILLLHAIISVHQGASYLYKGFDLIGLACLLLCIAEIVVTHRMVRST